MKQLTKAPLSFRVADFLARNGVRGGYRLLDVAEKLGRLNVEVKYSVGRGVELRVPLHREANRWSLEEVLRYDRVLIEHFVAAARSWSRPVTMVDCGADIGTIAVKFAAVYPEVERIIAIEPNDEAFPYLKRNLAPLSSKVEWHNAAVSDFVGMGELVRPSYDPSDHACFIQPSESGTIPVLRVDDLNINDGNTVLIKIDVEGHELNVLRGALETLQRAPGFVVAFEAHRYVAERTGVDPVECIRLLQSVSPCRIYAAGAPELELNADESVFKNTDRKKFDIVCVSRSPAN
ncbi:MAG: hypothetical protein Tsb0020_40450 [Haliangiales bacterium]